MKKILHHYFHNKDAKRSRFHCFPYTSARSSGIVKVRDCVYQEVLKKQLLIISPGGGELPYEEYMGVCHELGSPFSRKNSEKGVSFLTKIPERAIIFVRNFR